MADNDTELNLPDLRRGHNVPRVTDAGRWTSKHVNLETVADALPVDQETAFADQDEPIRAIPDPWAQATAFAEHLRKSLKSTKQGGKPDGLAARALSQWRGLLGIMALQHRHSGDFRLRANPVDLLDGSHFGTVMTTLTPEVAIAGNGDLWAKPTLIMLQETQDASGLFEKPIAMTNPVCLLSPGRDSHTVKVPNIHWAQGNLHDPLDKSGPRLSGAELSVLYHFVAHLAKEMQQITGQEASDLTRLLTDYVNDIQSVLNRAADKVTGPTNVQNKEPPLFQPLWNSFAIDESVSALGDRKSETRIRSGKAPTLAVNAGAADETSIEGFILVDQAVADALGKDASDILIWGREDLASLLKSEAKLKAVRKKAAAENYIVLTKDDLLTQRAAKFTKRAPLVDSHPDELKQMVLPVRPLAMLLSSNLREAISGRAVGDRAMVTLTLVLDDDSPDGKAVHLTRHYAEKPDGDDEFLLVSAADWESYNCQVWPDFKSPAWTSYLARFLHVAAYQNKTALPKQALSMALIEQAVAEQKDVTNAAQVLDDFNLGKKVAFLGDSAETPLFRFLERTTGEGGIFREEIQFSSKAFEAIFYSDAFGEKRAEAPVGMVLLDLPEIPQPSRNTKVAIDFGTTNTVTAIGGKTAKPLRFADRLVLPVRHEDQAIQKIAIHNTRHQFTEFLPPEERSTPIPTVAIPKLPYNGNETLWAFRNLIFFYTAEEPADGGEKGEMAEFLKATESAHFNLKWSRISAERDAAKDFLTQFMLMTAAELLKSNYDPAESTWYFSVPEALSNAGRIDFNDAIRRASAAIGQTGKDKTGKDRHFPPLLSEGLSAGSYMLATKQFASDKLNVILDIGGGTTDVTIWRGSEPVWRGSVHLAGRNFFTTLLVQNPHILETIGLGSWAKSLEAFDQESHLIDSEDRPSQMAEMLFSRRSDPDKDADLKIAMSNFWGRLSGQDGEQLRHAALTYISGVAWYVGKVVRQLMDETDLLGTYDPETQTGDAIDLVSDAAFAVCGRGGGIFQMMHGSSSRAADTTAVTQALAVFGKAIDLGDFQHPRFSCSDAPKMEVVRGMLNIGSEENEEKLRAESIEGLSGIMPAGLKIKHSDGELAADTGIDAESLPMSVQTIDLGEFEDFLEALEECSGIAVDIKPDERENAHLHIASDVKEQLVEMRAELDKAPRNRKARVGVEPPFLIALRSLVDLMAKSANDRNGLVDVWGAE